MRRGDVVIARQRGAYEGKPRPAVVIQADALLADHPSVLVCLITGAGSEPRAFYRIQVPPTAANGLTTPSTIMVDKIAAIRRENLGETVGRIEEATLRLLDDALALFQGLR